MRTLAKTAVALGFPPPFRASRRRSSVTRMVSPFSSGTERKAAAFSD